MYLISDCRLLHYLQSTAYNVLCAAISQVVFFTEFSSLETSAIVIDK